MQFPTRLKNNRLPPEERASQILRYMLDRAMLDTFGQVNILQLGKDIGYNHSSICAAFRRGKMTYEMAKAIENHIGRKNLPFEHLMNPLEAAQEKQ